MIQKIPPIFSLSNATIIVVKNIIFSDYEEASL